MDTINNCPVCAKTEFSDFLYSKDYFLSGEPFTIQSCNNCGMKITNPRPVEQGLARYYDSVNYISHSNTNEGFIPRLYQMVKKIALKKKSKLITKFSEPGKILDIGCGTGELLHVMKNNNWQTTGIEPNATARKYAGNAYGLEILEETELYRFSENTFDVVTLWHVLEHVFDLRKIASQIEKILKKNGILILALPNPDSLDAKIYGKYWAAFDVPRHLYHFTKKDVESFFAKFNFKLIKSKPMMFDSYYVSMLSEKYRTGKQNYPRAIFNGFISNIAGALRKNNYSSTIYILKSNIT